jgi:hypothetical protein
MTSIGSVFTCFQLRDDVIMCGTMAGTIQVYDLVSGEVVTNYHLECQRKFAQLFPLLN